MSEESIQHFLSDTFYLFYTKKEKDRGTRLVSSEIMTLAVIELNVIIAGNYTWPWKDGLIPFGKTYSVIAPGRI